MPVMQKIYGIDEFVGFLRQPTNEDLAVSKGFGLAWPILAIVEGTHFKPGGLSRNKRYYKELLWSKVLESDKVKTRMANHTILGRIGHEAEMTDEDIAEGKFSHFTTDMQMVNPKDGTPGFARTYILDTPMGRILYLLLKAKVRVYVSSRADGSYLDELYQGCKILDPDTYDFERFDFVLEPGFLEAEPKLVESFKTEQLKTIETLISESKTFLIEEKVMPKENEPFSPENRLTSKTIENLLLENSTLKQANEALTVKVNEMEVSGNTFNPADCVVLQDKDRIYNVDSVNPDKTYKLINQGDPKDVLDSVKAESMTLIPKADIQVAAMKEKIVSFVESLIDICRKEDFPIVANGKKFKVYDRKGNEIQVSEIESQEDPKPLDLDTFDFDKTIEAFVEAMNLKADPRDGIGVKPASTEDQLIRDEVAALGGIQAVKDALSMMNDYFNRVGTPEQIESTINNFDKVFSEIGNVSDIKKVMSDVSSFIAKNGNFDKIEKQLSKMEADLASKEQQIQTSGANVLELKRENEKLKKANEALKFSCDSGIDLEKVLEKANEGLDLAGLKSYFEHVTPKNENASILDNPTQTTVREKKEMTDFLTATGKIQESALTRAFGWAPKAL